MPKIELVRGIESIEGWVEVARLLKQKMKKWGHQLKDWTVRVRAFSKEDEAKSGQGDEDAFSDLNREKKVLTVAFKPISKTFTLTRRNSGPLKQSSYRFCKEGKFYNFSSISGVAFFIAEFIKPRSKDDLVTITVESTNLKQEDSCRANEASSLQSRNLRGKMGQKSGKDSLLQPFSLGRKIRAKRRVK